MCYAKPGPRCSYHAKIKMERTRNVYNDEVARSPFLPAIKSNALPCFVRDESTNRQVFDFEQVKKAAFIHNMIEENGGDRLTPYQHNVDNMMYEHLISVDEYLATTAGIEELEAVAKNDERYEEFAAHYRAQRQHQMTLFTLSELDKGKNPSTEMVGSMNSPLALETIAARYNKEEAGVKWKDAFANNPHLSEKAVDTLVLGNDAYMSHAVRISNARISPQTQNRLAASLPDSELWTLTKNRSLGRDVIPAMIMRAPEEHLIHLSDKTMSRNDMRVIASRMRSTDTALAFAGSRIQDSDAVYSILGSPNLSQEQKEQIASTYAMRSDVPEERLQTLADEYGEDVNMAVSTNSGTSFETLEVLSTKQSVSGAVRSMAKLRLANYNQ